MNTMQQHDVVIAGAGVIGLSLALELRLRGHDVAIVDRQTPGLASRAAAGMLAARDPHNPPALQPLADLALELYPTYLEEIRARSGHRVPIQTEHIVEADPLGQQGGSLLPSLATDAGTFTVRAEQSLNPRDLHSALLAAAKNAGVRFLPAASVSDGAGDGFPAARQVVDCTGAWSQSQVRASKGQMLRVQLPPGTLQLPGNGNAVLRTRDIYLVPRLDGSTVIGASVEDAGFDLTVQDDVLADLRARAALLVPAVTDAAELERWAGLRPRTLDDLPILGQVASGRYVANGLFRNGILLAPAVARVMTELLTGEPAREFLVAFTPQRSALDGTR